MRIAVRRAEASDWATVRSLLEEASLPLEGLDGCWSTWVAVEDHDVVATASLERHGQSFLLRSVAVSPDHRRRGIGAQLVATAVRTAGQPVVLLTETAADWFGRHGFEVSSRSGLDAALGASPELQHLCPDSAVVMVSTTPPPPP